LSTIDFDNKPISETHKINNIPATWRLTSKMESSLAPGSKVIPDFHLLRRKCFT
jgi:hypothetical protein